MTDPQDPYFAPPPGSTPSPPPGYGTPPPTAFTGFASWGQRAGAFLIDMVAVNAIFLIGFVLGAVLGSVSEVLGLVLMVLGYVAGFGFILWQLAVQGRTGQTIGKTALKIRLVREVDGQPVGAGLSIGRYFVHVLDAIPCYVGYLWPLWDAKKQTFADKILNTLVVKA